MSCCALSPGHSLPDGAELGSRCTRENTIPLASLEGPPQNSLVVMLFISVVIEARCCSMQLLWGLQQYCCADQTKGLCLQRVFTEHAQLVTMYVVQPL